VAGEPERVVEGRRRAMSYRQFFKIDHDAGPQTEEVMVKWFHGRHNGPWKAEFLTGEAEEAMTWYEFEDEMVQLSRLFPEVLFTVEVEDREEYSDNTPIRMWIRAGEMVKHAPSLVWPDPPDLEAIGR